MIRIALVLAFAAIAAPAVAQTVALPDTGLFAPVAAQLAERNERLAAAQGAEKIRLLLDTGRPVEAARLADTMQGDAVELKLARAYAALAVQDFAAAAQRIKALDGSDEAEARALRLAWLRVRDDAGAVDSLARTKPDGAPELLARARIAFDLLDYARAESLLARAETKIPTGDAPALRRMRASAHVPRTPVQQRLRKWDESRREIAPALKEWPTPAA